MKLAFSFRQAKQIGVFVLLFALLAPAWSDTTPSKPHAAGSRVIGTSGRMFVPEGAVVISSDTDPGVGPVPNSAKVFKCGNWDEAIARLKGFGDGSVPALVLSGHGSNKTGISTLNNNTWIDYPRLTDAHVAVIKAKLRPDAPVIILACDGGTSDHLRDLATKLNRRVIANTGKVNVEHHGAGEWVDVNPLPARGNVLEPGAVLRAGESRTSPNGAVRLVMQTDGNLVLYRGGQALWSSNTFGVKNAYCVMQTDGNLVVYGTRAQHGAVWASHTFGRGSWIELVLQDDCNLVLYQVGRPIWASNTCR